MRRATALLALTAAMLALAGSPAVADPAGPTNYDSRVEAVEGADGEPVPVEVEILGGDAYLVVRAEPGTRVEVPGYDGEPYLRIGEDGTVERNELSPARWLNEATLGQLEVDVPPHADARAEPVWRPVADDGAYAWHDHRIHWMSPSAPPQIDTDAREPQPVLDWEVGLVVDGADAVVRGELVWLPGPSPVVPVALVALALAVGLALVLTRRVPAWVATVLGAAPATVVGALPLVGAPPGTDTDVVLALLPPLALVLAGAGGALAHRDPGSSRGPLVAGASGLPLLVWGVLLAGVLTRPMVPGPLPVGAARATVAAALGLGAAALVTLAREALRAAPRSLDALSDEPDEPDEPAGPGEGGEDAATRR